MGVLRTIVSMDYILTPTILDLIIMWNTLAFSAMALDRVKNTKDMSFKDIPFFWNKSKKHTDVETCKSYAKVARELYLTVLDTKPPDLCRYEKEVTHTKCDFLRCTLLPPPPKQLEKSGLRELAKKLIVKPRLEHA